MLSMSLTNAAWFLIFVLASITLVIWLPYLWAPAGFHLRRSEGPWLINFDRTLLAKAVSRDIFYTIGLWLGLFFIRLLSMSPLFLLVAIAGMGSMFASA